MKILIACEESQKVCNAFRERGHDAISCDTQPTRGNPAYHHQGDVMPLLAEQWDMIIAFPPCTYLCNSGIGHLVRMDSGQPCPTGWKRLDNSRFYNPARWELMRQAAEFYNAFSGAAPKVVRENPVMHRYAMQLIQGADSRQFVQPWMFGHPEQKATGLQLDGVPALQPTNDVSEYMKTLSKAERQRLHWLPPGPERAKIRSETYQGIADAMAEQWG